MSSNMIHLAQAGSGLSPGLLSEPGGFLWWYLDLVDDDGNGLVVIWSYGLPFLPGYASAARRGTPQKPGDRPSLNVSVYRKGELDFYLLQEFDPKEVQWQADENGDSWRFGRSTLHSTVEGGQRAVTLDLLLDVPTLGEKARIVVESQGPGCCNGNGHHPGQRTRSESISFHDWTPILCACSGTAVVEVGDSRSRISGRLYHDRNGGSVPLHDLGIDSWIWGRVALEGRDFIYYVLDGEEGEEEALFLTIDHSGAIQRLTNCRLRRDRPKKNLGGLRWWPSMTIEVNGDDWLEIEHQDVVDSGPFYLRSVLRASDHRGGSFRGIAEVCEPDRVDMARHRPLVKMRVHHREELNSMWLPLFVGPRRGRVSRLLRSFVGR